MSVLARENGWRGFEELGTKVDRGMFGEPPHTSGWLFKCDGMPTPMGCGQEIVVTRRWTRVGTKKSGWLVMYGLEPDTYQSDLNDPNQLHEDKDVVLTFCPSCAAVVLRQ